MNVLRRGIVAGSSAGVALFFSAPRSALAEQRGEQQPRAIYSLWLVPKPGEPFEKAASATARRAHEMAAELAPPAPAAADDDAADGDDEAATSGDAGVMAVSPAADAAPLAPHVALGRLFMASNRADAVAVGGGVANVLTPVRVQLSTEAQHAALQVHVYDEQERFQSVGVEVVGTGELCKACTLANVKIMNDPAAETGLVRNPSIEDALNDVHARYRPHIAFFEGEVNHAADELEPIAKQVRSALVKSKELAGGFVAHDLALVEHGATYGERTEVARFPLRYGDLRD